MVRPTLTLTPTPTPTLTLTPTPTLTLTLVPSRSARLAIYHDPSLTCPTSDIQFSRFLTYLIYLADHDQASEGLVFGRLKPFPYLVWQNHYQAITEHNTWLDFGLKVGNR